MGRVYWYALRYDNCCICLFVARVVFFVWSVFTCIWYCSNDPVWLLWHCGVGWMKTQKVASCLTYSDYSDGAKKSDWSAVQRCKTFCRRTLAFFPKLAHSQLSAFAHVHFPNTALFEKLVFPSKFYTNFVRIWQHEPPGEVVGWRCICSRCIFTVSENKLSLVLKIFEQSWNSRDWVYFSTWQEPFADSLNFWLISCSSDFTQPTTTAESTANFFAFWFPFAG